MFADIVQNINDWVQAYPHWAGVVVFLVAMIESLAVVGVVVPGVAIMFAVGSLIGAGNLDLYSTMVWAICGASLGDGLSFAFGWHFKDRLYQLNYFKQRPGLLDRSHRFFFKYGVASVVLGRFIGPIRALVPMIAGMMEMPVRRYVPANIVASLFWAPLYLAPGLVVGHSYEEIQLWLESWWWALVVGVVGGWFLYLLVRRNNNNSNSASSDE